MKTQSKITQNNTFKATTSDVVIAYNVLAACKLTKMSDTEKFAVIKAMRAIRPIKKEYDENVKLINEKLRDDRTEEMEKKIKKTIERQNTLKARAEKENVEYTSLLSAEDRKEIQETNEYIMKKQEAANKYIDDLESVEVELCFDKLSDSAFSKLLESNKDIEAEKAMIINNILC